MVFTTRCAGGQLHFRLGPTRGSLVRTAGGARAVEQLRLVLADLQVATVRSQVCLSLFTDFENFTTLKPAPPHEKAVGTVLDEVIAWAVR